MSGYPEQKSNYPGNSKQEYYQLAIVLDATSFQQRKQKSSSWRKQAPPWFHDFFYQWLGLYYNFILFRVNYGTVHVLICKFQVYSLSFKYCKFDVQYNVKWLYLKIILDILFDPIITIAKFWVLQGGLKYFLKLRDYTCNLGLAVVDPLCNLLFCLFENF